MDPEDLQELIHRQILDAQVQFDAQCARGERTDGIASFLRSLRCSLRAISAGFDPDDGAVTSFILSVSREGQVFLRRDTHRAELSGPSFHSFLQHAGVTLVPGQVLTVEPEFAKRAIQDSLGETVAEEFRLAKRRAELRSALWHLSGDRQEQLLVSLGQLDDREAELLVAKIELSELNLSVLQVLEAGNAGYKVAPSRESWTT